jgi:hypothetical protein
LLSAIKKNDKTTINRLLQDFQKDIIARFPEESEGFEIPEYS